MEKEKIMIGLLIILPAIASAHTPEDLWLHG